MSDSIELGELITQRQGFAFSSEDFSTEPSGTILLTPGNFSADGRLTLEGKTKYYHGLSNPDFELKEGDVVTVLTDLTKEMNILGTCLEIPGTHSFLLNQRIAKLTVKNPSVLDRRYLVYFLNSNNARAHHKKRASGTTVRHSSNKALLSLPVFLPKLSEQERIVEILSDADAAIATAERLLASSQKKSDGIRGKCFENLYSVSEQALVTEHFDFINGMAFKPSDWSQDGLPIIRIQNLTDPAAGYNYFAGKTDGKYLVENGDFLLSWSATLGCFIWDGPKALLNQHIFKVLPRQENSIGFGYHLMRHFLHLMRGKVHGSSMKHITKKDLNTIKMPIPSPEKQYEVAQALDIAEAEVGTQHRRVLYLKKQKRGLMQQLLTGKLRVPPHNNGDKK